MVEERNPETVADGTEEIARLHSELVADVQRERDEIERACREAVAADAEADRKMQSYYGALDQGEKARAEGVLVDVRSLRAAAKRLRGQLPAHLARLPGLEDRVREISTRSAALYAEEEARQRQAQQRFDAVKGLLLQCSGAQTAIVDVREALQKWAQRQDQSGPLSAAAAENQTPADKVKRECALPSCPRCKRADDVVQLSSGCFRCSAAWHGKLIFNSQGRVLQIGHVRTGQGKSDAGIHVAYAGSP